MSIKIYGNYIAALNLKDAKNPSIITTPSKSYAKNFTSQEMSMYMSFLKEQGYSPTMAVI